jgi:hypothetical protein
MRVQIDHDDSDSSAPVAACGMNVFVRLGHAGGAARAGSANSDLRGSRP